MPWQLPSDYAPDQGAINEMRTNNQPGGAQSKLMSMIDGIRSADSVGLTLQEARELIDARVVDGDDLIAEIAAVADGDATTDAQKLFEQNRGA